MYREYVPTLLGYHTAAKNLLIPHHEGYFLVCGCVVCVYGVSECECVCVLNMRVIVSMRVLCVCGGGEGVCV